MPAFTVPGLGRFPGQLPPAQQAAGIDFGSLSIAGLIKTAKPVSQTLGAVDAPGLEHFPVDNFPSDTLLGVLGDLDLPDLPFTDLFNF